MTDNEKAKQFLAGQGYMVIAVVTPDGAPWAVPVRLQSWQDSEFEWDSKLDTLHSRALETSSKISITIFDTMTQTGFYAIGVGELIHKRGDGYGRYRFTAQACWLNDKTFIKREVTL